MSFFSKLTPPSRVGEKNFERARAAEVRRDFGKAREYFEKAAAGFDEHFANLKEKIKAPRPSHLVMAGISYVRLGRNEEALSTLDACIGMKEIPDAFLHAGFAAAKLGQLDKTIDYWSRYPKWSEERLIGNVLKEQVALLRNADAPDLQAACEAVVEEAHKQDKKNTRDRLRERGKRDGPKNKGY
ncbi:hypothetical protein [Pseudodesulfovibrio sp. zrk46]|uniref:hypothetical protein n=1 Tax=Pseudodesulfovibrio sp. zrk46 TaxID=2725288 RepID=UPI0014493AC9|nr:hypothetical protein [Pseudodesulfovibrio sp. zrk46]QJB56618.1 hypothetical protein HFN16_09440 [Pseudodesulfovibrio sp. zrk46]